MLDPIIQWVGGKKRILPIISYLLPLSYNSLSEIFLGGACLTLSISPSNCYLIELNQNIFNIYYHTKHDPHFLISNLQSLESTYLHILDIEKRKLFYLQKRTQFNILPSSPLKTSILLFLNKTCFNALYRENKKGEFNVPFGNGKNCTICNPQRILDLHAYLNKEGVKIFNKDFIHISKYLKKGDFVYMDPPYYPLKTNSFTNYTKEGFGEKDHNRLIEFIKELNKKEIYVMLSNSNNKYFKEKLSFMNIYIVSLNRTLNSNKNGRGKQNCEMIMTNYNKIIKLDYIKGATKGELVHIIKDKNNIYTYDIKNNTKVQKLDYPLNTLVLNNDLYVIENNEGGLEARFS
jgi:DNA adenine methylase